ncbi:MAG: cation-translocating P-type ATPase [Candidatus Thorarchaeota archaeon]|nr:MAG: cation-translocating P-type ATPase [Candidatus Thorarchaeota archaeon]
MSEDDWYLIDAETTLERLDSSVDGLKQAEAERRLEVYGPNELVEAKRTGPLQMFLQQFMDPLVIILLFAILISVAMSLIGDAHGEEGFVDAIVISVIVVFNAVFGFYQEYKSEKALEALKKLAAPRARVKRDGRWVEVESRDVVPGDVVFFESGVKVPADGRIFQAVGLSSDEAVLTGESVAARKTNEPLQLEGPVVGDMRNMVFQGSVITAGKGSAVITATGMKTQFGKIAQLVQESEKEMTPLQVDLEDMGKKVGLMILALCAIVFAAQVIMIPEQALLESFLVAIALAVAAIPEGLPAVVTITLAIGVQRMVRRNAIVRRLPSVETLGSTTVIASDKTGTITKNEMTVRAVYVNRTNITVTGTGYNRTGEFVLGVDAFPYDDRFPHADLRYQPQFDPHLVRLFEIGQMCANTVLQPDLETGNDFSIVGDPTEGAILIAAEKACLPHEDAMQKYDEVIEISFDSKRKRMTMVVEDLDGQLWAFVKGAPEVILERCTQNYVSGDEIDLDDESKEQILKINTDLAGQAMRVLAFAYRKISRRDIAEPLDPTKVEKDLIFVGLCGMLDPPREEVRGAVITARKAGIRPLMITGDHALTARAVARSVGLIDRDAVVISGSQLEEMTDQELARVSRDVDVFARVAPEHKLRIVKALKEQDHIVAMTGDGVNDAPAIKSADVGVSMGIRGADVTKEASDVILADDNFATIVTAVEVGREIYANIRKFVRYLLSANAGEVLLVFIMVMLGLPIPLIPVQILWLNLVTDGFPALALGVDPAEKGLMDHKGRKPGQRMLDRGMFRMIIVGGIFAFLSSGLLFLWAIWVSTPGWIPGITGPAVNWYAGQWTDTLLYARSMSFAGLILFELLFVFSCRDEHRPIWKTEIREAKYVMAAIVFSFLLTLLTFYSPLSFAFSTVPLALSDWLVVLVACLPAILVPYYLLFDQWSDEDGTDTPAEV